MFTQVVPYFNGTRDSVWVNNRSVIVKKVMRMSFLVGLLVIVILSIWYSFLPKEIAIASELGSDKEENLPSNEELREDKVCPADVAQGNLRAANKGGNY